MYNKKSRLISRFFLIEETPAFVWHVLPAFCVTRIQFSTIYFLMVSRAIVYVILICVAWCVSDLKLMTYLKVVLICFSYLMISCLLLSFLIPSSVIGWYLYPPCACFVVGCAFLFSKILGLWLVPCFRADFASSALDSRACVTQVANPWVIYSGGEGLRDLYCCLSRSKYSLLCKQLGLIFLG